MEVKHSKTKASFLRRVYVAYLIESGVNTVPSIMDATGMPRRTAHLLLMTDQMNFGKRDRND